MFSKCTHQDTIGASESPCLFGHGSQMELFERKINGPPDDEDDVPEWMEWGIRNEPGIRRKFAEMHPELRVVEADLIKHPTVACMHARPDGILYQVTQGEPPPEIRERGNGGLEIKTASSFTRELWDDGVPMRYKIQVQHQLACTGYKWGAVAVLIGGNHYEEAIIERDDELIHEIKVRCLLMAIRIVEGDPPPADGSEDCRQALNRLYPIPQDKIMQLPGEAIQLTAELDALKMDEKANKEAIQLARHKITVMLGHFRAGVLPDGRAWRRKRIEKKGHVVKASSYIDLRLVKGI